MKSVNYQKWLPRWKQMRHIQVDKSDTVEKDESITPLYQNMKTDQPVNFTNESSIPSRHVNQLKDSDNPKNLSQEISQ
jgi:hypothetical protein